MTRDYIINVLKDIKEEFISTVTDEGGVIRAEERIKEFENELTLAPNKRDIIMTLREVVGKDYVLSIACVALSDSKLSSIALETVNDDKFWSNSDEIELFFDLVYYALEYISKKDVYTTNSLKETCALICAFGLYISDKKGAKANTVYTVYDIIRDELESNVTKHEIRDFFVDGVFIDTNEYVCTGAEYNDIYTKPVIMFEDLMSYAGVSTGNDYVDKLYSVVTNQIKNAIRYVRDSETKGYNHNNMSHRAKMLTTIQHNIINASMKSMGIPNHLIESEYVIFKPAIDVVIRDILMNSVYNLHVIYKLSSQSIVKHVSEIKGGIINERLLFNINDSVEKGR